ncbi:MAG: HAD family hydrolase [Deltaproteobacteria bacterium]|nr:HAD family hydrolase [Deltaproteobacteria bacterium]
MPITGILFDLYGTLVDIETDESLEEVYRGIAHFLTYQGIRTHRREVRDDYYRIMKDQKGACPEECPEIDVERIWNAFLAEQGCPEGPEKKRLALTLAQLHRALSRKRLQLYPDVKRVLDELRKAYPLGLVSDAQPCYALPEMKALGVDGYFDPIVISADFGYRKPDRRLIEKALGIMQRLPTEVIFVGNDMYRDVYGAQRLGLKTLFLDSNQGAKSHGDVTPDYVAYRFADVLAGVEILRQVQ